MKRYNFLERSLHKIALTSQFMREITFQLEDSVIKKSEYSDNHIFIAGLARSGTTILLNSIYQSNQFASLSYKDMPFPLAPNLWSRLSMHRNITPAIERSHGDGIKISINSPEAFEEIFWKTFENLEERPHELYKRYISLILMKYNKTRYLSKNNQNFKRISLISDAFPNSVILVPFRDPAQQSNSLLSQHLRFIEMAKKHSFTGDYMKLIGHTEFGMHYSPISSKGLIFNNSLDINHWLEQWINSYKDSLERLSSKNNVVFICFERLCSEKRYWDQILTLLKVPNKYSFVFKNPLKKLSVKVNSNLIEKSEFIYKELCSKSVF